MLLQVEGDPPVQHLSVADLDSNVLQRPTAKRQQPDNSSQTVHVDGDDWIQKLQHEIAKPGRDRCIWKHWNHTQEEEQAHPAAGVLWLAA
jgi:hypothetical protein